MWARILNVFTGALGLAAVVASAPQLSYAGDCAAPSTETVFVTVSASSPQPSTVYVTIPVSYVEVDLSLAPTATLTRVSTLYSTIFVPQTSTAYLSAAQTSSAAGQAKLASPADSTITQTESAGVTITSVNLTPLPSGGSLADTQTASSDGLFSYIVENGTTCWLGGQTPSPGGTYAYSTSSIMVVPVYDPTSTSEQATSTLTVQSTLYVTQQLTLTGTLKLVSSSSSNWGAAVSAGTALPYSKMHGGWNATKTSSGGVYSGATNAVPASSVGGILATDNPTPTLELYSTFNIYETRHSTISLSTLAAASGFYAFSTPVSLTGYSNVSTTASSLGSSTSSASGQETTASISGVAVSSGGSSNFTGPYINSTSATSVRVTSAASGVLTSLSSTPSSTLLDPSSNSESNTSTDTCTDTPYIYGPTPLPINSTLATSVRATSGVSGILTSLSSSASGVTVGSSSSSVNSTSYSSTFAMSTASSSALGASTSSTISISANLSSTSSHSVPSSSSALPTSSNIVSTPSSQYSSSLASTSTSSAKTSTLVSSSASASPSSCGEYGDFILNFDDIPPLAVGNQSDSSVQPMPVFNPYHQFDFSDGFTVVPPPTDPYLPSSPPLLTEFIPNFNVNGTNTQAGPNTAEEGYSGQISDGDFDQTGCFRFNMYGAKFGCDSTGPPCDFTFTGYELNASRSEVQVAAQTVSVAACPALTNCSLVPVSLDTTFQNLAFVRINVTVANEPKIWWMDDLSLGWYNNSCTTGLCRQTAQIH